MDLDQALQHALSGDAVLFLGAGFSQGATNVRGTPLKTGWAFAQHLSALTGLPKDLGLDEAAEEFLRARGKDSLLTELKNEFSVSSITDFHQAIATAPWRRVYTTNYDNVFEMALAAEGRAAHAVSLSADVRSVPKELICVHLNGYIERLTRSNITSEIKLTDTSYLTSTIASSPWAVMFRQDLSIASAVFFIGYSLYDLDIRRILFEDPNLRNKCFFFIGRTPDEITSRRVARFGKALHQSAEDFAETLAKKRSRFVPPEHRSPILHAFKRYTPRSSSVKILDRDLFDLFLFGAVREELVRTSIGGGALYYRERHTGQTAIDKIRGGHGAVVVHSRLGNGKSLIIEGMKYRLFRAGFQVVSAHLRTERTMKELDQLLQTQEKTAIILDNYPDWLDIIEAFGRNGNDKAVLVMAARTATHDVLVDRVSELLDQPVLEYGVDRLSNADVQWVHDVFDTYGLWGERAAWSRAKKEHYLKDICKSEFHAILLGLLESPDILKRFEAILDPIIAKGDYHEAIVTMLVLSLVGHPPSLDMLADLSGESVLEPGFRRSPVVQQLVDFERGRVRLRSAVAAQFILKRITDPHITVDVLISLVSAADAAARATPIYRDLFRTMMRFSTIQDVLPNDPSGAAVARYYESVKNLEGARRNPLFWLQYGIAALSLEQLARAQKYFETAYSFAEQRPNYNTYQIDNHYARLLLMRASREGDKDERMGAFRKARQIVHEQIRKERLYYPFRVAMLYRDFFEYSESDLSPEEREEVIRAAQFVLQRIGELPPERQAQRYVKECRRSLELIIPPTPA